MCLRCRVEIIKDLGYQISFSVFDEASVAEWKGSDLRLAKEIPNMDVMVLAVRKDALADLSAVLASQSGMMNFLGKFWRGFYPLLLVELTPDPGEASSSVAEEVRKKNFPFQSSYELDFERASSSL